MANVVETERRMRRRGRWLCRVGWGMFAASLALPAVPILESSASGWECFRIVFQGVWDSMKGGEGIGWYFSGFALANLVMLLSPILTRWFSGDLRWLRRTAIMLAAASLYTASFPFYQGIQFGSLGMGYYAWVLSFCLVTAGALHLSLRRPKPVMVVQGTDFAARSAENLRAMHELENYLSGTESQAISVEQPAA